MFSLSVVSDSLWSQLQHNRLPCPSMSPRVCSKLMSIESVMPSIHLIPCHPLLLLPSIFPTIRVFSSESVLHVRWPKFGASASASVLPMNIQGWFPLRLTGLISLLSTIIYLCKPSCPWTFHTVTRGDSNAMNTPSCPCAHPSLFPLLVPPRATLQAVEYEYSNFTGYY